MKRVYALYRVSTNKQGTEEDIPMQKAECHKFAKNNNWIITKEYTEKVSGFQVPIEERHELFEIIADAEKGLFDILLVYYSDRLGRQVEFLPFYGKMEQAGVQVWSTKEGRISGQEHADTLMQFISLWMAEGESRKTSARVKDSMNQLFESGEWTTGSPAFGYKLIDTGIRRNPLKSKTIKKLAINEEEADILKMIFDFAGNKGWGTPKITKYLNDSAIPNRNGKIWRYSSVYRILRNPIYIGYRPYGKSEKVNIKSQKRKEVPYKEWKTQPYNEELVLISEELFNKVQEMMTSRGTEKKASVPVSSQVLLSGMLYCAECGSKMGSDFSYNIRKRKNGEEVRDKNYRYRCSSYINHKHTGRTTYGAKTLDKVVSEMILIAINNVNISNIEEEINRYKNKDIQVKQKQLEAFMKDKIKFQEGLRKAEAELEKAFIGESKFTEEQIAKMLDNFSTKIKDAEIEIIQMIEELDKSQGNQIELESFLGKLNNWGSLFEQSDLDSKKVMIGDLVEKIVLDNGKVKIFYKGSYEGILGNRLISNT